MTPENLARIRAIYEAALAKDALERAAFLDQECQGDQAIRQEVDLLLAAQQRLPDWLREPLLAPAPILRDSAASLPRMEGRQLSGYKLVREVGGAHPGHWLTCADLGRASGKGDVVSLGLSCP